MLPTLVCLACLDAPAGDLAAPELPPVALGDLRAFGPVGYEGCGHLVGQLAAQAELLERRLILECVAWRAAEHQAALEAVRLRLRAWELLGPAADPFFSECYRLQWLEGLRELIGPAAYFAGRMP